ncbi:hypothetical protein HAX54_029173 [Datura stramonium]|uniref:Uncharacterized protein n=1 Tax=Datura stramonium TaxID=4076 RepID=A0ABS8SA11_DATST|nr:hypothetical protein [Datura stramonium]
MTNWKWGAKGRQGTGPHDAESTPRREVYDAQQVLYRGACDAQQRPRREGCLEASEVKKGKRFNLGGLLNRFLRMQQVKEEEVNYKPSEWNARIDNILSHLYRMQMLQMRMSGVTEEQLNIDYQLSKHSRSLYRVGPDFKEPFDDDNPTNGDDGEDFEMGEASYVPTNDKY